jgi:predicted DNA-binding protein YlxM (UPF0122 family)
MLEGHKMIDKKRIKELRIDGFSLREIAERLKIKRKDVEDVLSYKFVANKMYEQEVKDNEISKFNECNKVRHSPLTTSAKKADITRTDPASKRK